MASTNEALIFLATRVAARFRTQDRDRYPFPDRSAREFQESDCRSPLGFRQRI